MPPGNVDEEQPLLHRAISEDASDEFNEDETQEIKFSEDDEENPRAWSSKKKLINVAIIALMSILSPLASSMFTPGIAQVAVDLNTDQQSVVATTTGFVIMLGFGPLVIAPLSETFGRRQVYIYCFVVFSLLQIPTAMAPNVAMLIAVRTISGFFGSKLIHPQHFPFQEVLTRYPSGVGIANGGGTISDMYEPTQRAGVFGWYLLGPLLGPTIGPLLGGVIITRLGWRWVYWILTIICFCNTTVGYFFLRETYTPVLLNKRKIQFLSKDGFDSSTTRAKSKYYFIGEDDRPLSIKLTNSLKRPYVIFVQPIVLTMSLYQAVIFGTTYSIYTNMQDIYSKMPYDFNSEQIGLLYLGPGLGFLTAVLFLVPRIDTIYNKLTAANNGKALPEYRLPLANVGSILIPISLFAFAWLVEARDRVHWFATIVPTYFYGVGQVMVFNTVQNYYIDSFSKYAASAIAAGSFFRSLLGGIVPLFAPQLFEGLGYGWGISVFAFASLAIAPSPLLFYYFGGKLREKFQITM